MTSNLRLKYFLKQNNSFKNGVRLEPVRLLADNRLSDALLINQSTIQLINSSFQIPNPKFPIPYLCLCLKNTLLQAIEAATTVIRSFDDIDFKVSNKEGINNLVTEVDTASEKAIIEVIKKEYPDHHILSEECGDLLADSEYKWIIDPIDGTVNFAHRIPICCISIGLEHKGQIIMGGVYNPYLNELFFAERGSGATLNGKAIQVSKKPSVDIACLATGFPYTYLNEPNGPLQVLERFIRAGIPVRRLGAAAIDLCYVACGRFDGFYEHKLQAWDSAAGFLIVEEAGGKVTNMQGNTYSPYEHGLISSNGIIHEELVRWIKGEK